LVSHHLIVGGQRSGKSSHAEFLARAWLQKSDKNQVCVIATALAADEEMRQRIAKHRLDRPSAFNTLEAPLHLARALHEQDDPHRLLLVDCLTLWLTNFCMPAPGHEAAACDTWPNERQGLIQTLSVLQSPVVLVSNEVGWGVVPMSSEVRHFVDELGRLNQAVANACTKLTLMVAGQAWEKSVDSSHEKHPAL
jgi:adenosylcobinamide kinase / adenosylcobinamide-phosphate guanylyltransferase